MRPFLLEKNLDFTAIKHYTLRNEKESDNYVIRR